MTGQRRNLVTRLSTDRNSHLTNFGDSSQFLIGRKVGRTLNFKLRVVHECGQGAQHRLHFPIRNAAPSNGRPVPLRESSSESTRFRSLFFPQKNKRIFRQGGGRIFPFLAIHVPHPSPPPPPHCALHMLESVENNFNQLRCLRIRSDSPINRYLAFLSQPNLRTSS